ncbi:nuclear transport factor 2 family protein [Streptomyces sp. NPDC088725]|uniref:nuclear transport factor 2 family protein n=1 Tax=Streptomyces sp. NPDC088725 TaxID=3365873 RepID=UPI0037F79168
MTDPADTTTSHCPGEEEVPVIRAFVNALNSGDLDAFTACFSDNGVVNDAGHEIRGRAAVADWADKEFLAAGGRIEPTHVHPVSSLGGDIVLEAHVTGAHRDGPGTLILTLDGTTIALLLLRS